MFIDILSTSKYISAGFFVLSVFMEKASNKLEFFKRKDKEEKGRKRRDMDWRCFGSGFVSVESHKEQSPRDCFL